MARSSQSRKPDQKETRSVGKRFTQDKPLQERISQAQSMANEPGIYANHAQMIMTNNDIVIDFFNVAPNFANSQEVRAIHVQRVTIPHTLGKGFVTALSNVIAEYEADTQITIPNQRPAAEEDLIKIWD